MSTSYVDAFAKHSAVLRNPQWSFSAQAEDGSIVVSCWIDFFVPPKIHQEPGVMRYRDTLKRTEHNERGRNELKAFLEGAQENGTPFKLIVARAGDPKVLVQGKSASDSKNRFQPRTDLVGSLVSFDGNEFVIDFRKSRPDSG